MTKKWFKKAVEKKPPYTLGCWSKGKSARARRLCALHSRPSNWTLQHKYRSAGRALQALANVTKDKRTKIVAKRDADYFFSKLK